MDHTTCYSPLEAASENSSNAGVCGPTSTTSRNLAVSLAQSCLPQVAAKIHDQTAILKPDYRTGRGKPQSA